MQTSGDYKLHVKLHIEACKYASKKCQSFDMEKFIFHYDNFMSTEILGILNELKNDLEKAED